MTSQIQKKLDFILQKYEELSLMVSDPEVIAPLSKLKDMLGTTNDSKIIELLLIIIELIKGGKDIHLINQIGTSEISREIIRIISEENSRTGG